MIEYEILLLLDAELDEARQDEIVARVRDLTEKGEGTWDLHDPWGRRKLAYEIDHKTDATYHLVHVTCEPDTLDEVLRVLKIDDGVVRQLATRRIKGSPYRPVAVSAPASEDVVTASEVVEEEEE